MIYFIMFVTSIVLLPKTCVKPRFRRRKPWLISNERLCCFLAFVVVFLVAALRYDVGTDYFYTYVPGFLSLKRNPDGYNYYEPAFKFLNLFCIAITDNYQSIFALTSLIVYGIFFYTICKWSAQPKISFFVYFSSSMFFNSLSNIRQAISMVICFAALERFLATKNMAEVNLVHWTERYKYNIKSLLEFYLSVFGAYFFHSSAVVFLVVPFLRLVKRIRLRYHIIIALAATVIAIYMNYSGIANQILNIALSLLSRYSIYNAVGRIFLSFLAMNCAIYALMYISSISSKMSEAEIQRGNTYINIQLLAIVVMLFSNIIPTADRIARYFMLCQCVSVPFFIGKISVRRTKIIVACGFFFLYIAWILFYILEYGADGCFPYQSVLFVNDMAK